MKVKTGDDGDEMTVYEARLEEKDWRDEVLFQFRLMEDGTVMMRYTRHNEEIENTPWSEHECDCETCNEALDLLPQHVAAHIRLWVQR